MAFQAVLLTASIDMIFTLNGVTCQNVFYAKNPAGYNLADLQALATAVDAQWQGTWRADQPAECTYVKTEVRGLEDENDFVAIDASSTNPGTDVSPTLPNNVTFAIKKESGQTGRSARGRTYWIGIPTSRLVAADENTLTPAYIANIVSNVESIRTLINGTGLWEAALVSRFSNGVKRDEGLVFPWVSTSSVNNVIDTMRGRLPK